MTLKQHIKNQGQSQGPLFLNHNVPQSFFSKGHDSHVNGTVDLLATETER